LEEYRDIKNIAEFAAEYYENQKRPLRIAVDAPYWRYKNVQPEEAEEIKRSKCIFLCGCLTRLTKVISLDHPGANPIEKNSLYTLWNILQRGIQVIFVFDGPGRLEQEGREPFNTENEQTYLFREALCKLGIACWDALGEAKAECARMQKLGLVDAVWTGDTDAFIFGSEVLIKFNYEKHSPYRKSKVYFEVFDLKRIQESEPCLNRENLILHAILTGKNKNLTTGLEYIGKEDFLAAAKEGLASSLCLATGSSIRQWRDRLVAYLETSGIDATLPRHFPDYQKVKSYKSPLISSDRELRDVIPGIWAKDLDLVDEQVLQNILVEKFLFSAKEYVKWITQTSVVRTLAREKTQAFGEANGNNPGQDRGSQRFQLKVAPTSPQKSKSPSLSNATFLIATSTSIDIAAWAEEDNKKAAKEWVVPERFKVRTLGCLLEQAAVAQPEEAESPRARRSPAKPKTSPKVSRKRQQSPEPGADAGALRAAKKSKGKGKVPVSNSISNYFQPQHSMAQLPEGSQNALLPITARAPKAIQNSGEGSSKQSSLNLNLSKGHMSPPSSLSTPSTSRLQKGPLYMSENEERTRDTSPTPGLSRPPQAHQQACMDRTGDSY
jgi:hypothetical protein